MKIIVLSALLVLCLFAENSYSDKTTYKHEKGSKNNPLRDENYYKKACKDGSASSCNKLGIMYRDGIGVTRNLKFAEACFTVSCNLEYKKGCENKKILLESHLQIPKNNP